MRNSSTFIYFIFLLIILFSKNVSAQDFVLNCDSVPQYFQKQITTNNGAPWIGAMTFTKDKGVVVVGSYASVQNGLAEACLIKADSLGNLVFSKILGVDGLPSIPFQPTIDVNEYFRDVIALPDTGFIALGPERSRLGPFAVRAPFLVRFDKNANIIWSKDLIFSENREGTLSKILYLENGEILLTGTTEINGFDERGAFVVKMDTNGNVLWSKRYSFENDLFILNAKPIIEANENILKFGRKDVQKKKAKLLQVLMYEKKHQ